VIAVFVVGTRRTDAPKVANPDRVSSVNGPEAQSEAPHDEATLVKKLSQVVIGTGGPEPPGFRHATSDDLAGWTEDDLCRTDSTMNHVVTMLIVVNCSNLRRWWRQGGDWNRLTALDHRNLYLTWTEDRTDPDVLKHYRL
jgi:hypothetical protein